MPPAMMMLVVKVRLPPPKIWVPRPPPPAKTASVAIATVLTVAIRRPAMISGVASGSSTFQRIWRSVMPHAAGGVLDRRRGTLARPIIVLR